LHVARLAHLNLENQEVKSLQRELSAILDYMDMLAEVDTAGVEPTFNVRSTANALRDDDAGLPQSTHDATCNAPEVHEGSFVVPRVIGQE
jgi:aspartyl-tRNA(Asn)/glutamyl-tRNA(Gln) amidotransferase subunit C